jgi:hypothetical protein
VADGRIFTAMLAKQIIYRLPVSYLLKRLSIKSVALICDTNMAIMKIQTLRLQ